MITVIAKLGSPDLVGQFALGLAITAPIVLFANMHLRSIQATDAKREYEFSSYFTLRTITTFFALITCLSIVLFGNYGRETAAVILFIAFAKGIDSFSDVFYGLFQQREQMDRISRAIIGNGLLSLILLTLGLAVTGSLIVALIGYLAGSLLPLIAYVIPTGRSMLSSQPQGSNAIRFDWEPSDILPLARSALPLGVVGLLVSLNSNIPRYFVDRALGAHELGVYAALAYLIVAGSTVVSALGQSASPRLAQYYARKRVDLFRSLLAKLVILGFGLGIVGALIALVAGKQIISVLYTSEYAEHIDALVVLACAAGVTFAASFVGFGMTAARYFGSQIPVFAVVSGTCLVASAVLIPSSGLLGAAIVVLVTSIVQLAASSVVVYRAMQNVLPKHSASTGAF